MAAASRSTIPDDLHAALDEAWTLMRAAPGFLSEREARFLALAAAATPAEGTILEIGSFKGKSTVGLAAIARRYALPRVVAVDPHTAPSRTDPDLAGETTTFDAFQATLRGADLAGHVEVHRTYSGELARTWNRPLRVLWIDGDHTYAGARLDVTAFRPFLVPGAVVALHDALHNFDGPLRVYTEEILASDDYGPVGFCGSIAWAQYRPGGGGRPWRAVRRRLARRARPLIAMFDRNAPIRGLDTHLYRFHKWRVPHGPVDPLRWAREVREGLEGGE